MNSGYICNIGFFFVESLIVWNIFANAGNISVCSSIVAATSMGYEPHYICFVIVNVLCEMILGLLRFIVRKND